MIHAFPKFLRTWQGCFAALMGALLWLSVAHAQVQVPLVTFGPQADASQGRSEGDQVLFIKIPAHTQQPLYVRIFDPDTGGQHDEAFGAFDTRTRFTLYGGAGAAPGGRPQTVLKSASFGVDANTDNRWLTFAEIHPNDGEERDGSIYFRFVVSGESGNDGNIYDVALSLDDKLNRITPGLEIFSYAPALILPKIAGRFVEVRLHISPDSRVLKVRNFDMDQVPLWFETPLSADYPLHVSGNGEWRETDLHIPEAQRGGPGAIVARTIAEQHNNAIFQVLDENGVALPLQLPALLHRPNTRPEARASVQFLSDCESVLFDAGASTDRDNHRLSYIWAFGDRHTGEGARVIHRYAEPGTYTYTLTARDDSGRIGDSAQISAEVRLNRPPKAVAGSDQRAAPSAPVRFDASASHAGDGKITLYRWSFGDGDSAEGAQVQHAFARPGLYRVRLRVEDDSPGPSCNYDEDTLEVWVNAAPLANAGQAQTVSPQQNVHFDASASSDSDGEIIHYGWDFGDGHQAEGRQVSHAYAQAGTYTATLTITDNAEVANSHASDSVKIKVNQAPVAVPKASHKHIAVAERVKFDASASRDSDGKIIAYAWDFGDGTQADTPQAEHAYPTPGTYTVTLRVTDDSATDSATHTESVTVIVNAPPLAVAGADQYVTASQVHFDASASSDPDGNLTAYQWDFGDGKSGSGVQAAHVYSVPGVYTVTLTVTDDSGTSTARSQASLQVRINDKPVADAGPDRVAMPGETLQFDGSASFDPDGEISRYEWDFGDGHRATEIAPQHQFEKPGRYRVRLKIADDSGHEQAVAFAETQVIVNRQPVAIAGADMRLAPGDKALFDGHASFDSDGSLSAYVWQFSDGVILNGAKVQRHFEQAGVYSATLQVTDDSGAANASHSDTLTVRVNHAPEARPGANIHTCEHSLHFDGQASLDADGDVLRYHWDFGDGTPPAHGAQVTHTYAKGGTYPVTLSVDDGHGLANSRHSAALHVTINQAPHASAGGNRNACAGELILFDGAKSTDPEGGRLHYVWDLGEDERAEGMNPVKLYKQGGWYPVTLTVEDDSGLSACNRASDRIIVQVAEAPVANAGADQQVCANTLVQFDGSASRDFDGVVNAYHWDFGDGSSGGGAKPTHMYTLPGLYRVLLTITGDKIGHCAHTNSDSLNVTVVAAPQALITAPTAAPMGEAVHFDASASSAAAQDETTRIVSYQWDFGDGNHGEGAQVSHVYAQEGRYFVTLTLETDAENACNRATSRQVLHINAPPQAVIAGGDRRAAVHEVLSFDASASHDTDGLISAYHWDFGDGNEAHGIQVRHRYSHPGLYSVTLMVSDEAALANSQHRSSVQVQVNAPPQAHIQVEKNNLCPDEIIVFDASASTDSDGNIVQYWWDFGDGKQAEGVRVTHQYAEPGRYIVVLRVEDDSAQANFAAQVSQEIQVNAPPVAETSVPVRICQGPLVLDASASTDADGKIISYVWEFDDGEVLEGVRVRRAYPSPGKYEFSLKVEDDSASSCALTESRIPVHVNHPPIARIVVHAEEVFSGGAHDAVLFDARTSSDEDNDRLHYIWDFGDRTSATGALVWHRFARPGTYTVRLLVQDDSGTSCHEHSAELRLNVKPF
jgi:large repetitive protein